MIIFILGVLGCILGILLSQNYKKRYLVYQEVEDFLRQYKLAISFSQTKIKDVVINFIRSQDKILFPFNDYINYLAKSNEMTNFKLNLETKLSINEIQELELIFNGLGSLGMDEEMEKTQSLIDRIHLKSEEKMLEFKKYANLYIKLGLIFGLGLGIILI